MNKKALLLAVIALMTISIASATDISSCQTISSPGTYDLTTDIAHSGSCIIIDASDIVFDCYGHTFTTTAGRAFTDTFGTYDNITIRNCDEDGTSNLVELSGDYSNLLIENLGIYGGSGVLITDGDIQGIVIRDVYANNADEIFYIDSITGDDILIENIYGIDLAYPMWVTHAYPSAERLTNVVIRDVLIENDYGDYNYFLYLDAPQFINITLHSLSTGNAWYAEGITDAYFEDCSIGLDDPSPSNPQFVVEFGSSIDTASTGNTGWFPERDLYTGDINTQGQLEYYEGCEAADPDLMFYYNNNGNSSCYEPPATPTGYVASYESDDLSPVVIDGITKVFLVFVTLATLIGFALLYGFGKARITGKRK